MTPTRPTILATDLVTLLGSPDPGLGASGWVRAVGTASFNPDSSTCCVLARAEENARALSALTHLHPLWWAEAGHS